MNALKTMGSFAGVVAAVLLTVSRAGAVVIDFNAPTYSDAALATGTNAGQSGWALTVGTAVGFNVSGTATDGAAVSVVNPSGASSSTFGYKAPILDYINDANTGMDVDNVTGTHWGSFDITLNSSSGTGKLFTLDFGRDGNYYKPLSMDVYQDGKVILNLIATTQRSFASITWNGFLTDGVKATISMKIDYDNLQILLYKDGVVQNSGSWIPFSDVRGADDNEPDRAINIGYFALQNKGLTAGSVTIDNLALGTGAVPEPATLALLGLGGLGALLRRRRA